VLLDSTTALNVDLIKPVWARPWTRARCEWSVCDRVVSAEEHPRQSNLCISIVRAVGDSRLVVAGISGDLRVMVW
jgi:hypothetical protein